MKFLTQIADRLVLCPSTEPIESDGLTRLDIVETLAADSIDGTTGRRLTVWTMTTEAADSDSPPVLLIKFPGNAGRAERSTANPAHLWPGISTEIWTVNPPGYGHSTGPASMTRFPSMVDQIHAAAKSRFPDHRLIIYGNSLGTLSALALAARYRVDGVYLRNPVPIHQLISYRRRYAVPSLGMSRLVANAIPDSLDAVHNAANCTAPCLIVTSEKDTLIPPAFQQRVIDAYAGTKQIFTIADAEHHEPIGDDQADEYVAAVNWLQQKALA